MSAVVKSDDLGLYSHSTRLILSAGSSCVIIVYMYSLAANQLCHAVADSYESRYLSRTVEKQ